jgi:leader peptidase (prepilin peptidase)/N-methyltransferase
MMAVLSSMPLLYIGGCLLVGLAVGSFLNVVIFRLPIMLERQWREQAAEPATPASATADTELSAPPFNLAVPRSACPFCKAPIRAWQNVPVISWLLLRGRCERCAHPISVRYPLVEALTGLLSAVVAWRFGLAWPALAALVLTWYLVALTFIDVDHQLLPDSLTLPLLWGGLFISLFSAYAGESAIPVDVRSSLIGAIAGYLSLWSVYHLFRLLTGKEGMGYGDFKLFAALGAWLGWQMLLPVILLAAVSGTVVGLALIGLRRHDRANPMPFGPFLAAAGWLVLVCEPQIAAYFGLF